MRGLELCPQTPAEGGETETNARKGIWNAFFTRPVCRVFLDQLDSVLAVKTRTETNHTFAYTAEYVG